MNNCNRVSRINSLVTKMLSNSTSRSSSNNNNTNSSSQVRTASDTTEQTNSQNDQNVEPQPSIRRNLFGIRLNHDQLKQDLKEMWIDQIERQKMKWNFDFEKLKPVTTQQQNVNEEVAQASGFKWTRVNTYYNSVNSTLVTNAAKDMAISAFNKDEFISSATSNEEDEDLDEEEEEEDEALAIPQFYKYQRRLKLVDKNCYKLVTRTPIKSSSTSNNVTNENKFEPIFKIALNNAASNAESNSQNSKIRRPRAIKPRANQTSLVLSPSTQNLIITFSENRKDTLRSASQQLRKKQLVMQPQPLTQTSTSQTSQTLVQDSEKSAFKSTTKSSNPTVTTNLKQTTLLDMLKQRKRRFISEQDDSKIETKTTSHYLRSAVQSVKN